MAELYDTCVFIDYWRGDQAALSLIESARKNPHSATYTPISATELWQSPGLQRREEIEFVALMRFFLAEAPLTTNAAMRVGEQLRGLSKNQRRRLWADALIAATAEERGDTVRTRNRKDMKRFYWNVHSY